MKALTSQQFSIIGITDGHNQKSYLVNRPVAEAVAVFLAYNSLTVLMLFVKSVIETAAAAPELANLAGRGAAWEVGNSIEKVFIIFLTYYLIGVFFLAWGGLNR